MHKTDKKLRFIIEDHEDVVTWSEDSKVEDDSLLIVCTYIKDNLRKKYSADNFYLRDRENQHFTIEDIVSFKLSPTFITIPHRHAIKTYPKEDERTTKNVYHFESPNVVRISKYSNGAKFESIEIKTTTMKTLNDSNKNRKFEDPLQNDPVPNIQVVVTNPLVSKPEQNLFNTVDASPTFGVSSAGGDSSPKFGVVEQSPTFGGLKPTEVVKEDLSVRKKVPLVGGADGISQSDFMKLSRENSNPLGRKVELRVYSLDEIKQHYTEDDAWIAVNGKVYDVTKYLKFHPGGMQKLLDYCGVDGTKQVNKYHPWVNVHFMLEKFQVGFLKQ